MQKYHKRLSKMPKIGKNELLPCYISVAHFINFKPKPRPLIILLDGQIWAFWNPYGLRNGKITFPKLAFDFL